MIRIAILVVLLGACTETIRIGDDRLSGLVAIEVLPVHTTIELTELTGSADPVELVAMGTFADGQLRDVTSLVAWTVDNPAPGSIVAPGRFLPSRTAGGHVAIQASTADVAGAARVDVIVTLTVLDGAYPPPLGAESLFADGTPVELGGVRAPAIVYPASGTHFPQGLARILFQLAAGNGTDAYRWRFDSDVLHLRVLTGSDRWQPDGAIWSLIGATHPAASVEVVVEAASSSAPGTIHASAPATLSFARDIAGGILYHWSAATNAVMRATLETDAPSRVYPIATDATCVGCHAVSRDGAQLALGYDGEKLRTISLAGPTPVITTPLRPMGWAAFAPDGAHLVVADRGMLTLRDAKTGEPIGPDGGRVPLPAKASHPDWAPDGRQLVVTLSGDISNFEIKNGSIARIAYADGAWGATEVLVAGTPTSNNYFPKVSPDGRFIAYVRAAGPSRGAPSAEIRLIAADGSGDQALRIANHRVGGRDDVPDLANTMPTWAPATGDLAWLAFTSARPYGAIKPTTGLGQIWVAAVDLARVAEGRDPSHAAFWLPAQDVRVLNNNPIWAPVVQTTN